MAFGINDITSIQGNTYDLFPVSSGLSASNTGNTDLGLNGAGRLGNFAYDSLIDGDPLAGLPEAKLFQNGDNFDSYVSEMNQMAQGFSQQRTSGAINPDYDVRQDSGVTAEHLNKFLKGQLAGKGQAFIDAGRKYGIDPAFLVGISMVEARDGKCGSSNNVMGIMDSKTGLMTIKNFGNVEECIEYAANNLKRNYIDKGLTTIAQIQKKHTPEVCANDPKGYNKGWKEKVTQGTSNIINQMA